MSADLSYSDWLVLGVLGTGATHGFAVSASLSKDRDLGRIWAVRRPMVYQSVAKLVSLGLVKELATERSEAGPSRTPLRLTAKGRRVLRSWLLTPVDHLRDMRPLLLAKLAFLERQGLDTGPLLDAQRDRLVALLDAQGDEDADDVQRIVDAWRRQAALAVLAFLDAQERTRIVSD